MRLALPLPICSMWALHRHGSCWKVPGALWLGSLLVPRPQHDWNGWPCCQAKRPYRTTNRQHRPMDAQSLQKSKTWNSSTVMMTPTITTPRLKVCWVVRAAFSLVLRLPHLTRPSSFATVTCLRVDDAADELPRWVAYDRKIIEKVGLVNILEAFDNVNAISIHLLQAHWLNEIWL